MCTYIYKHSNVNGIYRYYRQLSVALLCLICLPPMLSAQRSRAVAVKAEELLTRASEAYAGYQFDEALQGLEAYQKAQAKARKPMSQEAETLLEQVERAQKALRYAEPVQLVDSLVFPTEFLQEVLGSLSPYMADVLKPKGGDVFSLGYSAPIGGRAYVSHVSEQSGRELLRLDSLHSLREIEVEFLGEGVNTPSDEISPFVLPDGLVLFFARQSAETLGGYDLYWSRYSADRGQYYTAVPLGMPYNSLGNDYLLAYDDAEDVSYLLSDRFQPSGHLVLYRFRGLPQAIGKRSDVGQEDGLSSEVLRARALLQVPAQQPSPLAERYKPKFVEPVLEEGQPKPNTEDKI